MLIAGLGGCSPVRHGYPRQSLTPEAQIQSIESQFDPAALLDRYHALALANPPADEASRTAARNQLLDVQMRLIDLHYESFVARFSLLRKDASMASDAAVVGLGTAGALLDPSSTTRILAGLSSAITGVDAAFDANYFYEKSIPALIAAMNAAREEARTPILQGRRLTDDQYPLSAAMADLSALYLAGTIDGAVRSIVTDSGNRQDVAESRNTLLISVSDDAGVVALRRRIFDWLAADRAGHDPLLRDHLAARGVTGRAQAWLMSAAEPELQTTIDALSIP